MGIIQRRPRLQIQNHHGSLGLLDDGQNGGRGRVGSDVAEDQIDAGAAKGLAGGCEASCASSTRPALTTVAHSPMRCFHFALVALQPFLQPMELRPVRRQADSEYSHRRLFCLSHENLRYLNCLDFVSPGKSDELPALIVIMPVSAIVKSLQRVGDGSEADPGPCLAGKTGEENAGELPSSSEEGSDFRSRGR